MVINNPWPLCPPGRSYLNPDLREIALLSNPAHGQCWLRTFGVPLLAGHLPNVPKKFDLVSSDGTIVGDAKYFDMVRGENTPPAKFSIIAEHVWLLEKTGARVRFLVFGNNRLVPAGWLKKYGHLVQSVSFLFLYENGVLEVLSDSGGAFQPSRA